MRASIPLYKGRVIRMEVERAALPDGTDMRMEAVRHPGGVCAVVLDESGEKICFVRQYRPVIREWIWELPAGKRELGEDPAHTVHRELIEEAGVECTDWQHLGGTWSSPGFCDEKIELYSARAHRRVPAELEDGEVLEVHWVPISEIDNRIRRGEICDGKTINALALWRLLYNEAVE